MAAAPHSKLLGDVANGDRQMVEAYRQITGAYEFVHRMIRLFYNPHAITWAEVSSDGDVHRAHGSAMAAGHFMLSGDFFENNERYHKVFDLLENPKGFHRYANLVLSRDQFSETSCQVSWETAFGELVSR